MKITNYLLNQSSQVKNQLNKNHKLVKELIIPKTPNPLHLSKDKSINKKDSKKNLTEILKNENNLFVQLYAKTKKLYPTKVEEVFKDLILQYQNNDYKIPDLSDRKNLFNQNPLLLVGDDLEQFYMYNEKNKDNKIKNKVKVNKKHVNFIKKEMLYMEKIIRKNSEINKKSKNNSTNIEDDIDFKNEKTNYFRVDSVWDKIKEQKLKLKQQKKRKKMRLKKIQFLKKNNSKSTKISKMINESSHNINKSYDSKNYFINSYNAFYKYSKSSKNSKDIVNLKSINSNDTIKNLQSIDTINTNFTNFTHNKIFNNKNNKSETPIKKLKHNLLNLNLFNKNKESNKLLKEINEIKNTLNNSNLMEKNLILDNVSKISKSYKNKSFSNDIYYKSIINKTIPSLSLKKNFQILNNNNNNNNNINNEINFKKKINNLNEIIVEKKNNNDDISKENKLKNLKIIDLIKRRTLPYLTLNKILKENDPHKFLNLLLKVDLKMFNRKEIEKLMKCYCEKILGYHGKDIERIINTNRNDENIYRIIEQVIKKTKMSPIKYYGKYSLKNTLDEVNNSIFELKKKFIYGKTDYNYES